MSTFHGIRGRAPGRCALLLAALITAASAVVAPSAMAAPLSGGQDRAASLQAMLDRVLGPGGAVVTVNEERQTSTGTRTTESWGAAAPVTVVGGSTRVAGAAGSGTSSWSVRGNAVDRSTTTVQSPAGGLLRQTITVAVDRRHLGSTTVTQLKRLVATAAGLRSARGDRLLLVVATSAAPPLAAVAKPPGLVESLLSSFAAPAIWTAGGALALLIVVLVLRRRRPRET